MSENQNVLALYDCRSKQEYIYRTNKVKEIMGGSMLLTDLFRDFFETQKKFSINFKWEYTEAADSYLEYFNASDYDGEVIYEGGGNLCIIYKDFETYYNVNKILSMEVLKKTLTVSVIASCTSVTGNFVADREKLYIENAAQKNLGAFNTSCNVLPFTQVDRLTYQPITHKENDEQMSDESYKKRKRFESERKKENEVVVSEFDKMTEKGTDSILAVIYIDGNNMGKKIKEITKGKTDYTSGINALRKFSKETNSDFVLKPVEAITKRLTELYNKYRDDPKHCSRYLFRPIISGGDEITIVCNAHAVPEIIETYFSTLTSESDNSSCAGIALFHSHDPFADVYSIAEQCCEIGKEQSHFPENDRKIILTFTSAMLR